MWALLNRKTQVTIIVGLSLVSLMTLQAAYAWSVGAQQSPLQFLSAIVFAVGTLSLVVFNPFGDGYGKNFLCFSA